jgi:excinuclease ABC subunit A
VDGEVIQLSEPPVLKKQLKHDISVVVDRLTAGGDASRLNDSVETALKLGQGVLVVDFVDSDESRTYSEKLSCPNQHIVTLTEIEPRTFSFNAPFGACVTCHGIGTQSMADVDLVLDDPAMSIRQGVVLPWKPGGKELIYPYFERLAEGLAVDLDFSLDTPWQDLGEEVQNAVLYGNNHEVVIKWRNRYGRKVSMSRGFEGVLTYVERKYSETEGEWTKERFGAFHRTMPCDSCQGQRLAPAVLAVTINGKSISEVCTLSLQVAHDFVANLTLSDRDTQVAAAVLREHE